MRTEVYKLTAPNGKIYFGISTNSVKRWSNHSANARAGKSTPLYNSIRKYGLENFKKEIVLVGSRDFCKLMEKRLVEEYKTKCPSGLNAIDGGCAPGEDKQMAEQRSKAMLGNKIWVDRKHKEESKAAIGCAMIGNSHTKGLKQSRELVEARAAKIKGQKRTDEQKENMRRAQSALSEEISERLKGNKFASGTIWINDGTRSLRIKKGSAVPEGFALGRGKVKFKQQT